MKTTAQGLARRYAEALLGLATEQGVAEDVRHSLEAWSAQLGPERELGQTLADPTLPAERKAKLVAELFRESAGAEALVGRLVGLLVARGRAPLAPAISERYRQIWNERQGIVTVEAVSAVGLAGDEQARLAAAVEALTGRRVELRPRTDPGLLGGLILTLDGRVYDGSVRTRLEALRGRLLHGERRA